MKTYHFVNRLEKTGLLRKLAMNPNNTIARRELFRMYKIPPNIKFNGICDLFNNVKLILLEKNKNHLELVDFVKNDNRSSFHIVKNKNVGLKIPKLKSIKIKSASIRDETSTIQIRKKVITTCTTDIQGYHEDVSKFMKSIGECTLEMLKLSSKHPEILTNNSFTLISEELLKENGCENIIQTTLGNGPELTIYESIISRFNVYHISDSETEKFPIRIKKTLSIDAHTMSPVMLNWKDLWYTAQWTGSTSPSISIAKAITDAVLELPNVEKIGKVSNIRQSFFRACVFIEQILLVRYYILPMNATNNWDKDWAGAEDLTPSIENIAYRLKNNENVYKRGNHGIEPSERYKTIAKDTIKALS